MRSLLAALAALVLACIAVVPVHAQEQAAGATVTVENMAFGPAKVRVGMGETVTWSFQDAVSHTATSDEGFFDTGAASGGASRSIRFASAGAFAYHCTFHPMMAGKVTVPMAATGSLETAGSCGGWSATTRRAAPTTSSNAGPAPRPGRCSGTRRPPDRAGSTLAPGPGRYGRAPSRRSGRRAGRRP